MAAEQGSSEGKRSRRLSGEPALQDDIHFPPLSQFNPPDKLPTIVSIIGRLRMLSGGGRNNIPANKAVLEVAKEVESKYYHDTVFCKSESQIVTVIRKLWSDFREGKRNAKSGRLTHTTAKAYVDMIKKKDTLFDVSTDDMERKKHLEKKWGVKMGVRDKIYLEDQQGPRLMCCDSGVDPTWFRAFFTHHRLKELDQECRARREEEFAGKDIDQIGDWLRAEGEISSGSPESAAATPVKTVPSGENTPNLTLEEEVEGGRKSSKRKRLFKVVEESDSDPLPLEFRHLRKSERIVKDEFYNTCGALSGERFSLQECVTAVVTVGNGMFGRHWKESNEKEDTFSIDTAPDKLKLIEKLRQLEAQSLNMVVDEMHRGKEEGNIITHISDSTTKRGVGQFIGQVSGLLLSQ